METELESYSEKEVGEWLKGKITEMSMAEYARMLAHTNKSAPSLQEKLAEEPEKAMKIGIGCIKAGFTEMGRDILMLAKVDISESRAVQLAKCALRSNKNIEEAMQFLKSATSGTKMQFLLENENLFSREDFTAPALLIKCLQCAYSGKIIETDIRGGKEGAGGVVSIDIFRGTRDEHNWENCGTRRVSYGVRIYFCPKKGDFRKGEVYRESFETGIDIKTDKELETIIKTLGNAGVRIEWDEKSYLGDCGSYEIVPTLDKS